MNRELKNGLLGCLYLVISAFVLFITLSLVAVAGQKVCFYLSDKALEHKIKQEQRVIDSGFALKFWDEKE